MQSTVVLERTFARKLTPYETALAIGQSPIHRDILEGHISQQLLLHPASFIYTNHTVLGLGSLALGILLAMAGVGLLGNVPIIFPMISMGSSLIFLCSVLALMIGRFRGPAEWRETVTRPEALEAAGVPPTIARAAKELLVHIPYGRAIVGTLFQGRERLDPYLVVEVGNERVCLGIWIETTIIASAVPE